MSSPFATDPVVVQKAPAALAAQLREAILGGELVAGAQLPPERELAEQSGISRGSVREALRILEADGLIETRSGRSGGPVVRRPSAESLGRPVDAFIRGRAIAAAHLVETLLVVEPAVARLAAEKRTDADLQRLATANETFASSPDHAERVALNAQWHVVLGAATHNELLIGIVNGLAHAIHAATGNEAFAAPGLLELTVVSNEKIRQALEAQDADAAERRMRRHISYAAELGAQYLAGR
jgi:GntR family transcriptional repressor for pyruvate dehydrogenase complex